MDQTYNALFFLLKTHFMSLRGKDSKMFNKEE